MYIGYWTLNKYYDYYYYVKKNIHKRCSGVRGDLSRVADGFMCRRYDGTIQEADLAEDLMVDGFRIHS